MEKSSDYHWRSLAETAMYSYKQLIGPKLSLRHYNAQVAEMLIGVKVINKINRLGLPFVSLWPKGHMPYVRFD